MSCSFCVPWSEHEKPPILAESALKNALQLNPINVVVVGGGEPTFLPSEPRRLTELFDHLLGKETKLITNGVSIPKDEMWFSRFQSVRISLDCATSSTYERMKGRDCFSEVIKNIKSYIRMRTPSVGVSYVVCKENVSEVPDVIKLFSDELFDSRIFTYLHFKPLRGSIDSVPDRATIDDIIDHVGMLLRHSRLAKIIQNNTNWTILDKCSRIDSVCNRIPRAPRCYVSLLSNILTSKGDLYPCGYMARLKKCRLGSLLNDSVHDILTRQIEFFHTLNPGDEALCVGCCDDEMNLLFREALQFDKNSSDPFKYRIGHFFSEIYRRTNR